MTILAAKVSPGENKSGKKRKFPAPPSIGDTSRSPDHLGVIDPTVPIKTFVETSFIPRHVERTTFAGRAHYRAILKYIITPESVERAFAPHRINSSVRLKSRHGWPYLDHIKLRDLTADHVRQLVSCAVSRGYSPQTVKHIRNVIGAIVNHATKERAFSGDNPISEVELPAMTRRASHDLTVKQAKAILRVMKSPEREIALLTICTGMSIADICSLRWKDVNFTQSAIHLERKRIPPRSVVIRGSARSYRSDDQTGKHIRLSDTLMSALAELRERQLTPDVNGFVISPSEATSAGPAVVRMMRLKPIAKKLQMPWLSWQVLKRAHQTLLAELQTVLTDELVSSVSSQNLPLDWKARATIGDA